MRKDLSMFFFISTLVIPEYCLTTLKYVSQWQFQDPQVSSKFACVWDLYGRIRIGEGKTSEATVSCLLSSASTSLWGLQGWAPCQALWLLHSRCLAQGGHRAASALAEGLAEWPYSAITGITNLFIILPCKSLHLAQINSFLPKDIYLLMSPPYHQLEQILSLGFFKL